MKKSGLVLMVASHITDDLYQGIIPALLPFLVIERNYSYAAAAGITLAATILSSVAQPLFGLLTDKKRLPWLIPAGFMTAAICVSISGLLESYWLTWLVIAISGLGVAAYHPEAARTARLVTEGSQTGMSFYSLGGNLGFAIGPLLVTPVVLVAGVRGTPLLILPALVMFTVLMLSQGRLAAQSAEGDRKRKVRLASLKDDWRSFFKLTGLVVCRSILFYGLSSLLALYVTHTLGMSKELGEIALSTFLGVGAAGTLLGGWLADRIGRIPVMKLGYGLAVPALAAMLLAGQPYVFIFIALAGLALYLPFSVQVTLGQDYLPNRIGTASGVTLGLAISVGGMVAPLLGWLADATELRVSLALLPFLPLVAFALAFRLRDPQNRLDSEEAAATAEAVPATNG